VSVGQLFCAWGLRGPSSSLVLAITHPGVAVVALESPTWVDALQEKREDALKRCEGGTSGVIDNFRALDQNSSSSQFSQGRLGMGEVEENKEKDKRLSTKAYACLMLLRKQKSKLHTACNRQDKMFWSLYEVCLHVCKWQGKSMPAKRQYSHGSISTRPTWQQPGTPNETAYMCWIEHVYHRPCCHWGRDQFVGEPCCRCRFANGHAIACAHVQDMGSVSSNEPCLVCKDRLAHQGICRPLSHVVAFQRARLQETLQHKIAEL